MPKERRLAALPAVRDDINRLPTQRLKQIALQRIADVVAGRLEGQPLQVLARTGDLADCRKVYFDETGGRSPRFRIVYRLLARGVVEVVEVVAVEQREELFVYFLSAARLGRLPEGVELPPRPGPGSR